jgi:hypothetical protein
MTIVWQRAFPKWKPTFAQSALTEEGRAASSSEEIICERLFAFGGKMRCLMRVALYVWLTTFIRPTRAQSESRPSDRLWLLPWHVPPLY